MKKNYKFLGAMPSFFFNLPKNTLLGIVLILAYALVILLLIIIFTGMAIWLVSTAIIKTAQKKPFCRKHGYWCSWVIDEKYEPMCDEENKIKGLKQIWTHIIYRKRRAFLDAL